MASANVDCSQDDSWLMQTIDASPVPHTFIHPNVKQVPPSRLELNDQPLLLILIGILYCESAIAAYKSLYAPPQMDSALYYAATKDSAIYYAPTKDCESRRGIATIS